MTDAMLHAQLLPELHSNLNEMDEDKKRFQKCLADI